MASIEIKDLYPGQVIKQLDFWYGLPTNPATPTTSPIKFKKSLSAKEKLEWIIDEVIPYIIEDCATFEEVDIKLQQLSTTWPGIPINLAWDEAVEEEFQEQEFVTNYDTINIKKIRQLSMQVLMASADLNRDKGPSWPKNRLAGEIVWEAPKSPIAPGPVTIEDLERRPRRYHMGTKEGQSTDLLKSSEWATVFPNKKPYLNIRYRRYVLEGSSYRVEPPSQSENAGISRPIDFYLDCLLRSYEYSRDRDFRVRVLQRAVTVFTKALGWSNLALMSGRHIIFELELSEDDCVVCLTRHKVYQCAKMSGCGHVVCLACIREMYLLRIKDFSYTPSCCSDDLAECMLPMSLSSSEIEVFINIPSPRLIGAALLCHQCRETLPATAVFDESVFCEACEKMTCIRCARAMHDSFCLADDAMRALLEKVGKDWLVCPGCKNMIEKTGGCNHIVCLCGADICYLCGGPWSRCKCKQVGKFGESVRELVRNTKRGKTYEPKTYTKDEIQKYRKLYRQAEDAKNTRLEALKDCEKYMKNIYHIVEYIEKILERLRELEDERQRHLERDRRYQQEKKDHEEWMEQRKKLRERELEQDERGEEKGEGSDESDSDDGDDEDDEMQEYDELGDAESSAESSSSDDDEGGVALSNIGSSPVKRGRLGTVSPEVARDCKKQRWDNN
ncbi:hypothetical protein ABW19_dt0206660 [Dactylella cylindrospora]|nr:hypothetical protein ABW19_dt0206660 [Dactylella cylindrospora]